MTASFCPVGAQGRLPRQPSWTGMSLPKGPLKPEPPPGPTRHIRCPALLPSVLLASVLSCLIEGCAVGSPPLARAANGLKWTKHYGGDHPAQGPLLLNDNGTAWAAQPSGTAVWLRGIWGASGRNVFVVGDSGTILHYNGTAWAAQPSRTTKELEGIWGASERDVFVVGYGGTILHYNGTAWAAQPSGTTEELQGIWGASGRDVFAVGGLGTMLHYRGTSWAGTTCAQGGGFACPN